MRIAQIVSGTVVEIIEIDPSLIPGLYAADVALTWIEAPAAADLGWTYDPVNGFSAPDPTAAALAVEQTQLQAFLDQTDRNVIRAIDTGDPVYPEITSARAAARARIAAIRSALGQPVQSNPTIAAVVSQVDAAAAAATTAAATSSASQGGAS